MTAGDIVKGQLLVVERFTVKASEDIEKGELVYNDGDGILAATNAAPGPFFAALEAHDYSEESIHEVSCAVAGCVEVQKAAGAGIKKGQSVAVSATAGEVTVFTKGDAPASYGESTIQAALDANIGRAGVCAEDAGSDATSAKVWLGVHA